MVECKLVISTEDGLAYQVVLNEDELRKLTGLKIGDRFDGSLIGFEGYEFEITGGTDKDGFAMRPDLPGTVRKRLLLDSGPGYRPKERGVRRRKMVRGNTVAEDIAQLNVKVLKVGEKPLAEIVSARGGKVPEKALKGGEEAGEAAKEA